MDNKVRREKKWSGLLTVAGERNCDKVTYELWRPQQHQRTQGFSSSTGIGCFKNRSDVPKLVFPLATRPSVFYFPLRAYVGFVFESLLRFTLTHAATSSCVCTHVCECALYSSWLFFLVMSLSSSLSFSSTFCPSSSLPPSPKGCGIQTCYQVLKLHVYFHLLLAFCVFSSSCKTCVQLIRSFCVLFPVLMIISYLVRCAFRFWCTAYFYGL